MNLWQWINGKKTYIGILAAALFATCATQGWIDPDQGVWQIVAIAIGTWTGVAITHKANKAIDAAGSKTLTATLDSTASTLAPALRLTDTVMVREGDKCDQCGHAFVSGDRIFQRASPMSIVCEKCLKPTDLLVGQVVPKAENGNSQSTNGQAH